MAAEVDLAAGSKPAQGVFFSGLDCKRSLRQIVFSGYAEHQLVRKPLLQNADGSGIAMENFVGKGINNILLHFQSTSLFGPDKPGTPGNDDECYIDSQAVNCREQALYWTLRRMAEQAAFVENESLLRQRKCLCREQ